jgi:hypothetical protein
MLESLNAGCMSRSPAAVRYDEALQTMRAEAHRAVSAGIDSALAIAPKTPRRRTSYFTPGQAIATLFEGILDAVVQLILRTARPGLELEYADLVAATLVNKVRQKIGVKPH